MELDSNELLSLLHSPDPPPGHTSLAARLRWTPQRYVEAKEELLKLGLVVLGHRGSLKRVSPPPGWVTRDANGNDIQPWEFVPASTKESALYGPVVQTLRKYWQIESESIPPAGVHDTANSGSKRTGGRWSRPDATVVRLRKFKYVPGEFLEVSTIEVKPFNAIDVSAVYEAVAHRRAATHAYVAVHVPAHLSAALRSDIKAVRSVAAAHGVGFIRFADPADHSTWKYVLDAERVEPDPQKLSRFLSEQVMGEKVVTRPAPTVGFGE
ncbi:hypothetical protein CH286_17455 [Rhodococcus sp. WWJCD1]|nr:hypothetical protein CH286_17455 [Rhodococcus sp. WWJCD1]